MGGPWMKDVRAPVPWFSVALKYPHEDLRDAEEMQERCFRVSCVAEKAWPWLVTWALQKPT